MKNHKIVTWLLVLLFIVGCGGVSTYEEMDYNLPTLKSKPRLLYPKEAQQNNYSGTAKVYLHISETGSVQKVTLLESSGYDLLDDAALDYCKKIVFEPAKRSGEPICCKMIQEVSFTLLDNEFSGMKYISELEKLYRLENNETPERKIEIQNQILKNHDRFTNETGDVLNFNFVLEKVLLPDISKQWKSDWDKWPLSFLLYHDFLNRFPEYDSVDAVKTRLQSAVVSDIRFITNSKAKSVSNEEEKAELVIKIEQFMKKHYPDIPVHRVMLNAGISS